MSPDLEEKKNLAYLEQQGGVLMDCLITICQSHNLQVSRVSLLSGLPLDDGALSPSGFERAAKRAGLASRTVKRDLEEINSALLPAVLILKGKQACVLHDFDGKQAKVSYPELDSAAVSVSADDLRAQHTGYVIFARPTMNTSLNASEINKATVGHW